MAAAAVWTIAGSPRPTAVAFTSDGAAVIAGSGATLRLLFGAVTVAAVACAAWTFTSRLAWDDVVGVTASYGTFREILVVARPDSAWHAEPTTRFWRIDRLPPVPMIQIECSKYRVDSLGLVEFLRYYIENPHARGEFASGRAAARLSVR